MWRAAYCCVWQDRKRGEVCRRGNDISRRPSIPCWPGGSTFGELLIPQSAVGVLVCHLVVVKTAGTCPFLVHIKSNKKTRQRRKKRPHFAPEVYSPTSCFEKIFCRRSMFPEGLVIVQVLFKRLFRQGVVGMRYIVRCLFRCALLQNNGSPVESQDQ